MAESSKNSSGAAVRHTLPLPWRRLLRRLPLLATIVLGLLLPRLLSGHTAFAEGYLATCYPVIAKVLHALTGWAGFSLAECILYALILWAVILLVSRLVRCLFFHLPLNRLVSAILTVAITAGFLLDAFYLTWGISYFREPLSERLGITVTARSTKELSTLAQEMVIRANALRVGLSEDTDGVYTVETRAILDALPEAYSSLATENAVFSGPVVRVKSVTASRGLSILGISGIYIGLTAEANLNTDQPALFLAADGAHELAHGLGNAPENEAELTAILACCCSDDPAIRYSGTVKALVRLTNALYAADRDAYNAVRALYSDALVRDIAAYNAYWKQYDGQARAVADSVNDAYLKHNEVSSGVQSYGESVDLLLAVRDTAWGREILLGG